MDFLYIFYSVIFLSFYIYLYLLILFVNLYMQIWCNFIPVEVLRVLSFLYVAWCIKKNTNAFKQFLKCKWKCFKSRAYSVTNMNTKIEQNKWQPSNVSYFPHIALLKVNRFQYNLLQILTKAVDVYKWPLEGSNAALYIESGGLPTAACHIDPSTYNKDVKSNPKNIVC